MTDLELLKLDPQRWGQLSDDEQRRLVALSPRVETGWRQIGYVAPRLFPELGDDPIEAEVWHAIYGHCAFKHNLTAEAVREMPIYELAELLSADLRGAESLPSIATAPAESGVTLTVEQRMKQVAMDNQDSHGWSAQKWADHLGVKSKSSIAETDFWKGPLKLMKAEMKAKKAMPRDRRRRAKPPND